MRRLLKMPTAKTTRFTALHSVSQFVLIFEFTIPFPYISNYNNPIIPRNSLEFMRALQSAREYKIVENENFNECRVDYHFESLWLDKN